MKKKSLLKSIITFMLVFAMVTGVVPLSGMRMVAKAAETTVTYTFSRTQKNLDYLVFNGQQYLLNEDKDSDGYGSFWQTATVNCGDVSVSISLSSQAYLSVANGIIACTEMNINYTLNFSSNNKYITHIKCYGLTKDYEADNDSKTYNTGELKYEIYGRLYKMELTLSDTKPVRTYNINYELNGGTNAVSNPTTYADNAGVASFANPTRTGYDFGGWYDNSGFNGSAITSIPAGTTGDKTFYAKWTRKKYSYVDASGIAQTPREAELITSSSVLTVLTQGWYVVTEDTTCGTLRLLGEGTVNIILCDGATLSVENIDQSIGYPDLIIWGQTQGTGTLNFQEIDALSSVTVNSGRLLCNSTNGNIWAIYLMRNGSLIVNGGEVHLSAGSVQGSVAFNGGKLNCGIIYGDVTLNWSSAADRVRASRYNGSVTVVDGKYFKDSSGRYYYGALADWQKNAIKCLELQPAPDAHTVTVNNITYGALTADKAVAETGDTVTVTVTPQVGYAASSVRYNGSNATRTDDTHYTFTMPDGDVNVTAGMTPIQYTISYAGMEGASLTGSNPTSYTIENAAITLNNPTRTGYDFAGWTGTGLSAAAQTVTIPTGSTGDRVYTATWTPHNYFVSFNGNGSTGGGMSMQGFTYDEEQALTACAFSRTDYHFTGWNTANDGSGTAYEDSQSVSNLTEVNGVTVTLYAQWEANTYTVRFDPVTSVYGEMTDQTFTYGVPQTLNANAFSMTTGEWLGWNTAADGSGTSYADQAEVVNLTAENGGVVTLYAQWRVQNHIWFDGDIFNCVVGGEEGRHYFASVGESVNVRVLNQSSQYTIIVTGADGEDVEFDDQTNTFIMPDQQVWISSTSVKKMAYTYILLDNFDSWEDVVYLYDANNPTVTPTITVMDGERTLTEGTDYTLSITNNTGSATQMITAIVTVTAVENSGYVGTNTTTFRISPFDIANCTIGGTLEAYDDGYGPFYPLSNNVEVWYGETQLELDTDYDIDIKYVDTYEIGQTYQATITGRGDWGGTQTFTFTFVALHHTVVFDPGDGGIGTMDSGTVANDGGNAGRYYLPECTFIPPYGYVFDHWEADCEFDEYTGGLVPKQPGDYFTAPFIWSENDMQEITVTAYWKEKDKYDATLPEQMEVVDGIIEEGQAYEGEAITFRAKAEYIASDVMANGASLTPDADGNYTLTVIGDVIVTATFTRKHSVTIADSITNGTVITDVAWAVNGEIVTITVISAAKYMPVYDPETHMPVTVTAENGEEVLIITDEESTPLPNTFTFQMPDCDVTVSASFVEAVYDIYLSYLMEGGSYPARNGSLAVTADGDPVTIENEYYLARPDQAINLTVSPAPGYALVEITGVYNNPYQNINGQAFDVTQDTNNPNRWSFTMPDGATRLWATMRKLPVVTFMVDNTEYASVPTDETGYVTPPDDPTKEGWQFATWHLVNDQGEMSETAFSFDTEITGDITLRAVFAELYNVTVNSSEGGTVTADPASAVAGKAIALDIQPAAGYLLDTLTVTDANGNPVVIENEAFKMPAGDVTVTATFTLAPPAFGTPDFTMPSALSMIEESAFEGITNMTVVDASNCTTIGKWAFKGCTGLNQIKLLADCSIDPDAFDGCGTVFVYAPAGGSTEVFCAGKSNLIFVEIIP